MEIKMNTNKPSDRIIGYFTDGYFFFKPSEKFRSRLTAPSYGYLSVRSCGTLCAIQCLIENIPMSLFYKGSQMKCTLMLESGSSKHFISDILLKSAKNDSQLKGYAELRLPPGRTAPLSACTKASIYLPEPRIEHGQAKPERPPLLELFAVLSESAAAEAAPPGASDTSKEVRTSAAGSASAEKAAAAAAVAAAVAARINTEKAANSPAASESEEPAASAEFTDAAADTGASPSEDTEAGSTPLSGSAASVQMNTPAGVPAENASSGSPAGQPVSSQSAPVSRMTSRQFSHARMNQMRMNQGNPVMRGHAPANPGAPAAAPSLRTGAAGTASDAAAPAAAEPSAAEGAAFITAQNTIQQGNTAACLAQAPEPEAAGTDFPDYNAIFTRLLTRFDPFDTTNAAYEWWACGEFTAALQLMDELDLKLPTTINRLLYDSFSKHRHAIFGRYAESATQRQFVILGIPAIKTQQEISEHAIARWMICNHQFIPGAYTGYWLYYIDAESSALVKAVVRSK